MTVAVSAYIALLLFVPLSAVAFVALRPPVAVAALLLAAALFLPERVAFDPPLLPPFDKITIASLCALAGALLTAGRRIARARPGATIAFLLTLLVLANVLTSLTNRDPLVYGARYLPGLTLHDALSDGVKLVLAAIIPFYLGFALFRTRRDLIDLMKALVVAGLLYVPFILIELRMSPQFHRWVYGFHQHDFVQTIRDGGYRPMVFMRHGLAVAGLIFTSVVAAAALSKARISTFGLPATIAMGVLGVVLVLCKSLAALLYAAVAVPLILFASVRRQTRVAMLLAAIVLAYPALRATDTFPTQALVDLSARVAQARADSLEFRFDNEDRLVKKARERLLFGWGGFGRNRVYNADGGDISVTDGAWIGILGAGGVTAFGCTFALLLLPIFRARRTLARLHESRDRVLLGGLAVLVALSGIDLLPNGMFSALPLFLAGTLCGLSRGLVSVSARAAQVRNSDAGSLIPDSTSIGRALAGAQPSTRRAFEQSKNAAAVRPSQAR